MTPERKGAEMTEAHIIQTAYDMKAVTILLCCDLAEKLKSIGDHAGAHALVTLVKTLEAVQTADTGEGRT